MVIWISAAFEAQHRKLYIIGETIKVVKTQKNKKKKSKSSAKIKKQIFVKLNTCK